MHAIRRAEPRCWVVERPTAQRALTTGRNGIRAGVTLSLLLAQGGERLEDLCTGSGDSAIAPVTAVGHRIIDVLRPLPDVAGQVEVTERTAPIRIRTDGHRRRALAAHFTAEAG